MGVRIRPNASRIQRTLRKVHIVFIIQALLVAKTEHVVYFMLAAWLETLEHKGGAAAIPEEARRLPVRGLSDVRHRLALVREKLDHDAVTAVEADMLRIAAATFGVACEKLREFSVAATVTSLVHQRNMRLRTNASRNPAWVNR